MRISSECQTVLQFFRLAVQLCCGLDLSLEQKALSGRLFNFLGKAPRWLRSFSYQDAKPSWEDACIAPFGTSLRWKHTARRSWPGNPAPEQSHRRASVLSGDCELCAGLDKARFCAALLRQNLRRSFEKTIPLKIVEHLNEENRRRGQDSPRCRRRGELRRET